FMYNPLFTIMSMSAIIHTLKMQVNSSSVVSFESRCGSAFLPIKQVRERHYNHPAVIGIGHIHRLGDPVRLKNGFAYERTSYALIFSKA
ncbi:MAG TPA: hypothetical protein VL854_11470, partial [Nitrososphaeraceae archaeon]|nr:hypothetical protein [Nitrososphaeraceae archaeon]